MKVLVVALLACHAAVAASARRNTIIIYADDFGFDVGAFGAPTVRTPNLDRLAAEGAKLTQYAAALYCIPYATVKAFDQLGYSSFQCLGRALSNGDQAGRRGGAACTERKQTGSLHSDNRSSL